MPGVTVVTNYHSPELIHVSKLGIKMTKNPDSPIMSGDVDSRSDTYVVTNRHKIGFTSEIPTIEHLAPLPDG